MPELVMAINNVWIILCGIIVFFMQAGFAMLESGLVRSKNAVNVIMKNYIDMSLGSLGFWFVGFGIMFGANTTGWFGTSLFMPNNVSGETFSFLFFQMMFAATAATIVSGALAERIRYWPYIFAAALIASFIYPVFGSWVWGSFDGQTSGWLKQLGYLDFAGSSVVHALGGWCALAGIIVLGPRVGRFPQNKQGQPSFASQSSFNIPGHNLPMAALGAFILWFGFFAFNAGSTLEANNSIGRIVLNTHLSGISGVISVILLLYISDKQILAGPLINGGLGGLVAICAGANAMTPGFAIVTGLVAGLVVFKGTELLEALKLDDPVGAVPVHAFAGTWGIVAIGLFQEGNLFNLNQIAVQSVGIAMVFVWAFPTAWLVFKGIGIFTNLRVSVAEERRGLDYSEHAELGYPEFQDELLHQGKEETFSSLPVQASKASW